MAGTKAVGNTQLTVKERCIAAAGAALVAAVVVNPLDVVKVCIAYSSRLTVHRKHCCTRLLCPIAQPKRAVQVLTVLCAADSNADTCKPG